MSSPHDAEIGTSGKAIDDFRMIAEKTDPPNETDGLLLHAAGSDDDGGLRVLTVWESKAHEQRWEAEQLFPAFQAAGIAPDVMANTVFTTYEATDLYIR
jgi:heme-degrading monooxygenase HmoA